MCMAATGTACRRLIYLWTRLQGAVCPLSIVLYFAAIYPRYPAVRNTPDGHGFDLIGIPPLRGSLEAAPIAWVCGWTEVSLSPLPVIAVFAVPCKVQVLKAYKMRPLVWLARPGQQKESIRCADYSVVKVHEIYKSHPYSAKNRTFYAVFLEKFFKKHKFQRYIQQKQHHASLYLANLHSAVLTIYCESQRL